jgi:hypothetical protein
MPTYRITDVTNRKNVTTYTTDAMNTFAALTEVATPTAVFQPHQNSETLYFRTANTPKHFTPEQYDRAIRRIQ